MPQRLGLKHRRGLGFEDRESMIWILVRIPGEAEYCLELAERFQPLGQSSPVSLPPALNENCKVGSPQKRRGKESKVLTLAKIQKRGPQTQYSNLFRGTARRSREL